MDPQQLPKTSKFYSRCKKCDIEKALGGGYHLPLDSPKVNMFLKWLRILISSDTDKKYGQVIAIHLA